MTQSTEPQPDEDLVEIKDFTVPTRRIRFKIDQDVFEAHPVMGLTLMQQLIKVRGEVARLGAHDDDDDDVDSDALAARIETVISMFDKLLLPDSARRMRERAGSLDLRKQLIPIIYYVMEQHGLRPTQPSPSSSPGLPSGNGGTPSTAGASSAESASPS